MKESNLNFQKNYFLIFTVSGKPVINKVRICSGSGMKDINKQPTFIFQCLFHIKNKVEAEICQINFAIFYSENSLVIYVIHTGQGSQTI